jgi:hypothetical protein
LAALAYFAGAANGETTDADGKTTKMAFTAKLDGTDAPVTGNPMGDTISIKHPSPTKLVGSIKQGGKPAATVHVVISADERTRTVTETGKTADGKAVHIVMYTTSSKADPQEKGQSLKRKTHEVKGRTFSEAEGGEGAAAVS